MIKAALIKDGDYFYTREYTNEEDLKIRDKTSEYGEYNDIDCAIEDLFKIHKGKEFIIKLIL